MPLYEYECESCGRVSEELIRRPADEAELACQGCGDSRLKRLISSPAARSSGDCGPTSSGGFG